MHTCKLSNIFTASDLSFIGEMVEESLEEAYETQRRHLNESPPLSDTQTTSEAAQDYVNLIETQRQRIAALEKFRDKLRSEVTK